MHQLPTASHLVRCRHHHQRHPPPPLCYSQPVSLTKGSDGDDTGLTRPQTGQVTAGHQAGVSRRGASLRGRTYGSHLLMPSYVVSHTSTGAQLQVSHTSPGAQLQVSHTSTGAQLQVSHTSTGAQLRVSQTYTGTQIRVSHTSTGGSPSTDDTPSLSWCAPLSGTQITRDGLTAPSPAMRVPPPPPTPPLLGRRAGGTQHTPV